MYNRVMDVINDLQNEVESLLNELKIEFDEPKIGRDEIEYKLLNKKVEDIILYGHMVRNPKFKGNVVFSNYLAGVTARIPNRSMADYPIMFDLVIRFLADLEEMVGQSYVTRVVASIDNIQYLSDKNTVTGAGFSSLRDMIHTLDSKNNYEKRIEIIKALP